MPRTTTHNKPKKKAGAVVAPKPLSPKLKAHLDRINKPGGRRKRPAAITSSIEEFVLCSTEGVTSQQVADKAKASIITTRRVLAAMKRNGLIFRTTNKKRKVLWFPKREEDAAEAA